MLVPTVQQVLNETVEWAKTIREVAECAPECDRWRELLGGSWGLLELLRYRKDGFDQDKQRVANARRRGLARMASERRAKAAAEEDERKRLEAAEAARVAALEAQRLRRNAASRENAGTGAGIGAVLGGIVLGFSGCVSCVSNLGTQHNDFNLFNGLFFGAIGGAIIGALIGFYIGQDKD